MKNRFQGNAAFFGHLNYFAIPALTKLRTAVIHQMVIPAFTMDDFIDFAFHAEDIALMRLAFPLVENAKSSIYSGEFSFQDDNMPIRVWINSSALEMLPLRSDRMSCNFDHPAAPAIRDYVKALCVQIQAFRKVFDVIKWLDKHATPAAVRYYWPSILPLLPMDHKVALCSGQRFTDPPGISALLPLIRETAGTLASAFLCNQTPKPPEWRALLAFTIDVVETVVLYGNS